MVLPIRDISASTSTVPITTYTNARRALPSTRSIMVVSGAKIKSRLISPREAARLMGLPDSYKLPEKYNEAYHLMGDGVVVPVVSHLNKHLLLPIANLNRIATDSRHLSARAA